MQLASSIQCDARYSAASYQSPEAFQREVQVGGAQIAFIAQKDKQGILAADA
jgi:hypothetical protein